MTKGLQKHWVWLFTGDHIRSGYSEDTWFVSYLDFKKRFVYVDTNLEIIAQRTGYFYFNYPYFDRLYELNLDPTGRTDV